MKKLFALALTFALVAAIAAGCGKSAPAAKGTVKTGLAVVTSIANSADATAADAGVAQGYSTIAAVTVDGSGKIVSCVIDAAQTNVNFGADGAITTALDSTFQTKNELGAAYGMKTASSIGKEWNEQAAAFAAYVVGKTAEEVNGIAVDAGLAMDADLVASVTIHVTDFIEVVSKAVANASELGASSGDKLRVGTVTSIAKSTNATADAQGLAQVYNTYAALTTNETGVITSCVIDASQANINFDTAGKITTPLDTTFQTKDDLKDVYGMKAASGIGKEWYEQAAAFAAYATGKTAAEVAGTAVDETGHVTGADLTASVTVSVGDFMAAIAKAAK